MNLLAYTKKLAQQIAYYDKLTEKKYNIFSKPISITIVWVDEKNQ